MRPDRTLALALLLFLTPFPGTLGDEPAPPADVQGEAVRCPIPGEIRIVTLKRSGDRVKKGELLCELDTLRLRERLVEARFDFSRAQADYLNAKLTREVAEITTKEQEEAVIPGDLSQKLSAVTLAKTELALASEVFTEAKAPGKAPEERIKAEANVTKAKTRLEEAQSALNTFKTTTIPNRKKGLQAEIARCKAVEAAKLAAKDAAETRVKDIKHQIELCRIVARSDGRIVHPRPDPDDVALGFGPIEEGTLVHERQILFWFIPDAPARSPLPGSPAGK